ncbi:uncharacterized protein LOC143280267 [Babylonia areolata]|uniref:uncharacterized protein LOC143280267 n=1 Tax=Babylonia areolata TaxID=304850 RepID=UPI003FD21F3E
MLLWQTARLTVAKWFRTSHGASLQVCDCGPDSCTLFDAGYSPLCGHCRCVTVALTAVQCLMLATAPCVDTVVCDCGPDSCTLFDAGYSPLCGHCRCVTVALTAVRCLMLATAPCVDTPPDSCTLFDAGCSPLTAVRCLMLATAPCVDTMKALVLVLLCLLPHTAALANMTDMRLGSCSVNAQRCIKQAKCRRDACVCKRGYTGDGEMECFKKREQQLCTLDGRGIRVRTWDGDKAPLPLPCCSSLTSLRTPLRSIGKQVVRSLNLQILACSSIRSDGDNMVDTVHIVVKVFTYNTARKRFVMRGKKRFSISVGQVLEAKGGNPWPYPQRLRWQGLTFRFLWDKRDEFAIFLPPLKGASVKFRAHHMGDPYNLQVRKPGLSLLLPRKDVGFRTDPAWHGLCTRPWEKGVYREMTSKWRLGSPSVAAVFSALTQFHIHQYETYSGCRQARRLVKRCRNLPKLAVMTCAFLLDPQVVLCLKSHSEPPMKLFVYCLRWTCLRRKRKCLLVKQVLDELDCDRSDLFRKIGCSRKRLRKANERVKKREASQ